MVPMPWGSYVWGMRVQVEVCVTSLAEAMAADRLGADRVELCSWAACGGITPCIGLVNAARAAVTIPIRVLVRPRPHGFVHDTLERRVLLADVQALAGTIHGVVTGGLSDNGTVDMELMREVLAHAADMEVTLHRAIDDARDPELALVTAIELGVQRILTSGGAARALDGAVALARAVKVAQGRVQVAAAGGIAPENVVELVERTGVGEVHFLAQRRIPLTKSGIPMSTAPEQEPYAVLPDEAKIEGVLNALTKAGLR